MSMELRRGENRLHIHAYSERTTYARGHTHRLLGVTELPRPVPGGRERDHGQDHDHDLVGRTTFDDGHWHYYRVRSGEEVEAGRAEHFHRFSGRTEVADGHVHRFDGRTEAVPEDGRRVPRPLPGRLGEALKEGVEEFLDELRD